MIKLMRTGNKTTLKNLYLQSVANKPRKDAQFAITNLKIFLYSFLLIKIYFHTIIRFLSLIIAIIVSLFFYPQNF